MALRHIITQGVDSQVSVLISLMHPNLEAHLVALGVFSYINMHGQVHWKTFAAYLLYL